MRKEEIKKVFFMFDINLILNKLLKFYDLDTISELSGILKVSQPTISKWKARNTVIPLKKKCKELGIYDEIFGDLNKQQINKNEIKINDTLLEQVKDKASKFGLDLNSYIEHLIVQDLKKQKD